MNQPIHVTVWGEYRHEKTNPKVAAIYPRGIHRTIAEFLQRTPGFAVRTATLDEPEHGLPADVLDRTDVLTWWGHKAHGEVRDEVVERVRRRVLEGMGLIVLHSGHYSKIFKALMGTSCSLKWREASDKERIWTVLPSHPIAEGLGEHFELPAEEMYGEPFGIPAPDELIFISWFTGGEVFRSGCAWRRGHGRVFYFRPGHETYPTYHQAEVQRVISNAVRWTRPTVRIPDQCPKSPPLEPLPPQREVPAMSPAQPKGPRPVRLAVIGTGAMAANHAKAFEQNRHCRMVAAVDVDRGRVDAFCRDHAIPAAFTRTADMLAQTPCDAVTIVAPDAFHAPLAIACLRAGKHVLCEKPLALNYPEAKRMVAAARKSGLVNLVNLSYRNWPVLHAVAAIVQGGRIGDVRHVEANYLQSWLPSKVWGDWRKSAQWLWRLSSRHGSTGVLGDVGVHIMDFATYPAGPIAQVYCRLKAFPKAKGNRVGPYLLDANDSAVTTVEFANGALGTIHATRWATGHVNRLYLKISGTKGAVEIDSEKSTTNYRICHGRDVDWAKWREVAAPPVPTNYERFIAAIQRRKPGSPDFARGAEIQKLLDACFESDKLGRPVRL